MNISGNTVFIPGSTSGIGLALALALQAKGNTVIIGGRRADLLERIAAVDLDGVDAGVPGGDLIKQVGSPAADDHGVAPGVQFDRQGEADAAGGAGDEDGVA